jgi:hypothetical protein
LQVWRVEWNVMGTLLASSGDDGVVKLWKKTHEVRKARPSSTPCYEGRSPLLIASDV